MASPNEQADGGKFPAADIHGELNPAQNMDVNVDPVSSQITNSLQIKKNAEAAEKKNQNAKRDAMQKLKSTIIISAVIVAVSGAAFAVTKKLREK
ncbi:hypothetical protein Pint_36039 [Pistacia integerrima]|uniref:Uncharacterized protein n=1 Tax=Pistacia integerrima TaxID=434235 RepID=A0ACC0XYP3_9ROSI|nr:hypothetical protein Pint_36039 [Pistacia integerrima]